MIDRIDYKIMKLKKLININNVEDNFYLDILMNPNAYKFMLDNEKYFGKNIDEWYCGIYYKKENGKWKEIINWDLFCHYFANYYSINLLYNNFSKINWNEISFNPNVIDIISNNLDKINWSNLCENYNAYNILKNNFDKIVWNKIIYNKNAVFLIKDDIKLLTWNDIYDFMSKYIEDKYRQVFIHTISLCDNKHILKLLDISCNKNNQIINSSYLDPSIFEYDYDTIMNKINIYKKELLEKVLHPTRLMNICNKYGVQFNDLMNDVYI